MNDRVNDPLNDPVARRLVDSIIADFPDHQPLTRPIHTIGIGVKGWFEPSEVARDYCIAKHFQGPRIRATVRFSNVSGSPKQHDGWNDVRGMATRFHFDDRREGRATDLIAMTLGGFFVRSVDEFFDFTKSALQTPVKREAAWRKICDMLSLKPPLPNPYQGQTQSGDAGTLGYADKHPFAQLAVFQAGMIGAPVSYVRAVYHAVHTFFVVGPDHVRRPVRFSWKPVAGVQTTDPRKPPRDNYLADELRKRLKKPANDRFPVEPARMMLMMMIGEAGDVLEDPTVPWPARRQRVVMGTLSLNEVAEDQVLDCEKMSFNPWRLVPGIEPSADPLLKARRNAYEDSRKRRGVTQCPFLPE
jgi:catalase